MTPPARAPEPCHDDHCITCGDVAVEMTVIAVDEDRALALCETAEGERESVEIALISPVRPAEHLLVHAGTAISRLAQVLC